MKQQVGVLLVQLGTPDAPTYFSVMRYLRQFLSDRRVIEVPTPIWLPLLYGVILPFRSSASAAKYRLIWHEQTGSPLMHYSRRQTQLLQEHLPEALVRFGMQIGKPSVRSVLHEMIEAGVERLIVMPMYPQYSATTTASATDAVFRALMRVRRVPAVRVVAPYYDHPAYLDATTAIVREELAKLTWQPDHFLFSYHGIPQKYAKRGDPYATHVVRTTRGLVERLGLSRSQWTQTYQSRFGRSPWLKPYTDDTLEKMAQRGIRKVFAITPGFTADCLETIDEIGREAREAFQHAGGELLHQCPCLNDHPQWIAAMRTIILDEARGWLPATPTLQPKPADLSASIAVATV